MIIQGAGVHHHDARQRIRFVHDAGAAFRAEAAMNRPTGVSRFGKCLEHSGYIQDGCGYCNDGRERGAGEMLTVIAMANTDKYWVHIRTEARPSTKATTLDTTQVNFLLFSAQKPATPTRLPQLRSVIAAVSARWTAPTALSGQVAAFEASVLIWTPCAPRNCDAGPCLAGTTRSP